MISITSGIRFAMNLLQSRIWSRMTELFQVAPPSDLTRVAIIRADRH